MTTSRSNSARGRERPAWAEPVEDGDRIVRCGGCGRSMTWREFVHAHLQVCGEPDPRKAEAP